MAVDIQILEQPLDADTCRTFVQDPECGGIVEFIGNVRNRTQGRRVIRLEFESYIPMAIKEMQKIGEEAIRQFGVKHISIHHRIGLLSIGETAVIIAVSSGHRKESFAACQYAIDTLKETVPIWKKEIFEDGEVWVAATP